MKGKDDQILSSTDERTASQIQDLLKSAKRVIDLQVSNLTELCTGVESFIRLLGDDRKSYKGLNQAYDGIADIEKKKELKDVYTTLSNTSQGWMSFQSDLALYTRNEILLNSRKLLSK